MKTTKRPSAKLTKRQMADALARAMNLLMDLRNTLEDAALALGSETLSTRQENEFYEVVAVLDGSEEVKAYFWNNGTLDARDLI